MSREHQEYRPWSHKEVNGQMVNFDGDSAVESEVGCGLGNLGDIGGVQECLNKR